jgi:hypothetical protein
MPCCTQAHLQPQPCRPRRKARDDRPPRNAARTGPASRPGHLPQCLDQIGIRLVDNSDSSAGWRDMAGLESYRRGVSVQDIAYREHLTLPRTSHMLHPEHRRARRDIVLKGKRTTGRSARAGQLSSCAAMRGGCSFVLCAWHPFKTGCRPSQGTPVEIQLDKPSVPQGHSL